MYAIEVHDVCKVYKNGVQALNSLNIKVKAGEVFSLLGENGTGKSTLIKILTTFLKPTSGDIYILGKDLYRDAAYIRSNIACVSQQTSVDTHLSLQENMIFQANLYKIPKEEAAIRMTKLIKEFDLISYTGYPVSSYSGGVKRRLDIAMNMMTNPKILFLDEPTVGMDIQSRKAMWKIVKKIRDTFGTTVFLTTHYLEEADHLSDTICIMRDGHEAIQGSPYELKEYLQQDIIKVTLASKDDAKMLKEQLSNDYGAEYVEWRDSAILIAIENRNETFLHIISFLVNKKIMFTGIEIIQPTIEDVFLRLTGMRG